MFMWRETAVGCISYQRGGTRNLITNTVKLHPLDTGHRRGFPDIVVRFNDHTLRKVCIQLKGWIDFRHGNVRCCHILQLLCGGRPGHLYARDDATRSNRYAFCGYRNAAWRIFGADKRSPPVSACCRWCESIEKPRALSLEIRRPERPEGDRNVQGLMFQFS